MLFKRSHMINPHPPTSSKTNKNISGANKITENLRQVNISKHTIFRFLSLNPQITKKRFPQSSFRTTWVQTCSLIHFIKLFWGRNSLVPSMSWKIKSNSWISEHRVLVHKPTWSTLITQTSTKGPRDITNDLRKKPVQTQTCLWNLHHCEDDHIGVI